MNNKHISEIHPVKVYGIVPKYLSHRFTQKCNFYDLNKTEVIKNLIELFMEDKLDKEFNITRGGFHEKEKY